MLYKINWLNKKTVNVKGIPKEILDTSLTDEAGVPTDNVVIWPDFPGFSTLAPGSTVEGSISTTVNGKFTNHSLYPKRDSSSTTGRIGASGGMKAAQERKAEMISEAQSNKERGIKLAATMRDATLLTIEWIKSCNADPVSAGLTDEDIKKKWLEWRRWLDNNFGDGQPF